MTRSKPTFVFGEFKLDSGQRNLLRRECGTPIALSTHTFEALLCMLERPGAVVDRATLLSRVWQRVRVSDNSVSQTIAALRRALGDDSSVPRYVFTVPGRGYRFRSDVVTEVETTRDSGAYQLYVAGWSAVTRPGGRSLREALHLLKQATERDPDFLLAHAAVVECCVLLCTHGLLPREEALRTALMAATRAVQIDPRSADARTALAKARQMENLNLREEARSLSQALELDPRCYQAHRSLGLNQLVCGEFEDALVSFRRAQAIDPLAVNVNSHIGMVHYYAGRYDDAIAQFELTLRMDEQIEIVRAFLGRCFLRRGEFDRALAEFGRIPTTMNARHSDVPVAHALSGNAREARSALTDLLRRAELGDPYWYDIATIHMALGEEEAALAWLERAVDGYTQGFFTVDPMFGPIREHPRFRALRARFGLL
jgi:DNA-binding winged helix-turn-helix (wHTH) protein/cytochrome c-type biogenesis protein CcmH/NrfG